MTIRTGFYGEHDILVVELTSEHITGDLERDFSTWTLLRETIVSAIESDSKRSRFDVPLIAIDVTQAKITDETFEKWLRWGPCSGTNQVFAYIQDRGGKFVFIGNHSKVRGRGIVWVTSVEEAAASLVEHKTQLRLDNKLTAADVAARLPSNSIRLVGCPENDLGTLPNELREFGFDVEKANYVSDGERIVFCISANNGLTSGTKQSIRSLHGKTISPIAIVLTYSETVDNDSLRQFVDQQEREMLLELLPAETVDRLPLLLDLAPNMVSEIVDLASKNPAEVRCKESSTG